MITNEKHSKVEKIDNDGTWLFKFDQKLSIHVIKITKKIFKIFKCFFNFLDFQMIVKRYELIKDSSLPPNLTFKHSFLKLETYLTVPSLNEEAPKLESKMSSNNTTKNDYKKLFIRNIPRSKTEDEIKKYFKLYLTKINPISMNRIKTEGEMSTWLVHFKQRIGKNCKYSKFSN